MNVSTIRALMWAFVLQPTNEVVSFSMDDDTEVLNLERNAVYPQLQMSEPSIRPELQKARTHRKTYRFEVAILAPVPTDDWAKHREEMERLEEQMIRLLTYLNRQRHSYTNAEIVSLGELVPIRFGQNDSLSGYALSIGLKVNMTDYYCNATTIYEVVHLSPVFEEGETQLGIQIGATEYRSDWKIEKEPMTRPLKSLAILINIDTATHGITATQHLNQLLLSQSVAATAVPFAPIAGAHSWNSITT